MEETDGTMRTRGFRTFRRREVFLGDASARNFIGDRFPDNGSEWCYNIPRVVGDCV